jgi:hypothetical protein
MFLIQAGHEHLVNMPPLQLKRSGLRKKPGKKTSVIFMILPPHGTVLCATLSSILQSTPPENIAHKHDNKEDQSLGF